MLKPAPCSGLWPYGMWLVVGTDGKMHIIVECALIIMCIKYNDYTLQSAVCTVLLSQLATVHCAVYCVLCTVCPGPGPRSQDPGPSPQDPGPRCHVDTRLWSVDCGLCPVDRIQVSTIRHQLCQFVLSSLQLVVSIL